MKAKDGGRKIDDAIKSDECSCSCCSFFVVLEGLMCREQTNVGRAESQTILGDNDLEFIFKN
jgi:hypothetical protein